MEILQDGSGPSRDIALLYLAGSGSTGPQLAEHFPEGTCVVADKAANFFASDPFGPEGVTRWDAMVASLQESLGFTKANLWLVGFSAGCWAVRAQLAASAPANYVLAVDGIHLSKGDPPPAEQTPWLEAAALARARDMVFSVSVSATPANKLQNTRDSAKHLFGWNGCLGSYDDPCVEREGFFSIYGATYGGANPTNEHKDQLIVLLPRMIDEAQHLTALGSSSTKHTGIKVAGGLLAGGLALWGLSELLG